VVRECSANKSAGGQKKEGLVIDTLRGGCRVQKKQVFGYLPKWSLGRKGEGLIKHKTTKHTLLITDQGPIGVPRVWDGGTFSASTSKEKPGGGQQAPGSGARYNQGSENIEVIQQRKVNQKKNARWGGVGELTAGGERFF